MTATQVENQGLGTEGRVRGVQEWTVVLYGGTVTLSGCWQLSSSPWVPGILGTLSKGVG